MFSILGIRWPFWVVSIAMIGAAIVLVGAGSGTNDSPPTIENSRSPVPVVGHRQTENLSKSLADGNREDPMPMPMPMPMPSTIDSEDAPRPAQAPNRHQAELEVLRENPQLSPTWRFERTPGNLGEPPKTGIE